MNTPNCLSHDEIKKRGFADGFREETPLSVLEFRTVQRVREAPTAPIHRHGDASVLVGPNDADRRGAPVLWDTVFFYE